MGLLPLVVEGETSRRAYNLGICAAQAPVPYFLLRRVLEAGGKPSAVVVDYKPNLLVGGPRDFARNWAELLTPREAIELAWSARDATFLATIALSGLLPTVRARHDLRANIRVALEGGSDSRREGNLQYRRNWEINRGAQVSARSGFGGQITAEDDKIYLSNIFWCDKVNRLYIRKFLALAASRDIPVYWLLPPISPTMQARREATGVDQSYARFVRSYVDAFPNLTVLDGRHSGYINAVFNDAVHLDGRGASLLSADVAALLARGARSPSDGRWVGLPAFRDRPIPESLEALDQSALLARLGEARRRR
jgi:hypothetical protein